MKSKKLICGAVAVAITMTATFTGCVTINEKDMKQTIATVDITKSADLGDLAAYSDAITEDVIVKRQLVAAFINAGSSYISAGYSYAETFNLLVESLIANSAVTQYTILYVLKEKTEAGEVTLAEYNAKEGEAAKLEYLLGGENSEGVLTAKYSLYSSLNSLLDSYEKDYLTEGEDYVGIGPGAVSTINGIRYSNTRDTDAYIRSTLENGLPLSEQEPVTEEDYRLERIALMLRTDEGLPLKYILPESRPLLEQYRELGLADISPEQRLILKGRGRLLVDAIAAELC